MFTQGGRFCLGDLDSCSRTLGWPAERLWLLQTWSTCSTNLQLWILSDRLLPSSTTPAPIFTPSSNHDYTGKLICFIYTKRSPHSLPTHTCPCFQHKRQDLIQEGCIALLCSTAWQQEQGGVKRLIRELCSWDKRRKHFCFFWTLLALFTLQEVINCHHLPSNTQAAAQTGTPGPPLELWATYSPAGFTQTTA